VSLAFIDRPPTDKEMETFRLVLSTYQDYTYQDDPEAAKMTRPEFRDYGRTVARVFNGRIITSNDQYGMSSFDVIVKHDTEDTCYALSCHMFGSLDRDITNNNYITSERWKRSIHYANRLRISMHQVAEQLKRNFFGVPPDTNEGMLEIRKEFLNFANLYYGAGRIDRRVQNVDTCKSYLLLLVGSKEGQYQLHQFSLQFPTFENLRWYSSKRFLYADDEHGRVFEWTPGVGPGAWYFLPVENALWSSPIFKLEPPGSLRGAEKDVDNGEQARERVLKVFAIEELQRLIDTNAKESEFQKHLERNYWMLGSDYSRLLDIRQFFANSQLDFALLRAADNYLEIIEIKTPLNGKALLIKDDSHEGYYFSSELSQAIGQALKYIERIDSNRYAIEREQKVLVNGVRAKLVIGRDGDEDRRNALRRMNSHFHRIEILTYDQLAQIARNVLKFLG
jgi:hypothetical protein